MLRTLSFIMARYQQRLAPAFVIGLLRAAYGIIAFQEILFLLYFNHLIF